MGSNLVGSVVCSLCSLVCLIAGLQLNGLNSPHYPHGFSVVLFVMGACQGMHAAGMAFSAWMGWRERTRYKNWLQEAIDSDPAVYTIPYPGPRKGG